MNDVLFSSSKTEWETPDTLFDSLNREFSFTLDAAASPYNAKVEQFICEDHWYRSQCSAGDALTMTWRGRVWLNPPYGRDLGRWLQKAKYEAEVNAQVVVCLIPARTDTAYWHNYIWNENRHMPQQNVEVRLLRGRLKFKGAPSSAPFPSAIIVFRAPMYRPKGG